MERLYSPCVVRSEEFRAYEGSLASGQDTEGGFCLCLRRLFQECFGTQSDQERRAAAPSLRGRARLKVESDRRDSARIQKAFCREITTYGENKASQSEQEFLSGPPALLQHPGSSFLSASPSLPSGKEKANNAGRKYLDNSSDKGPNRNQAAQETRKTPFIPIIREFQ